MLKRHLVDRRFRLARHWSNDELRRLGRHLGGDIVNVSGWRDEDKDGGHYRDYFPNAASYVLTNYTGTRGAQGTTGEIALDLTGPLPSELEGRFDVVFNHTTLEHIYEVQTAIANLAAMSRDLVLVVVPFAQVQHELDSFQDFWRFTPTVLERAFGEHGLTPVYCSSNDDRNAAVYVVFAASRHPAKWAGVLPAPAAGPPAGDWIGRSLPRKVVAKLVALAGRASS
jgi:hypothetical protein